MNPGHEAISALLNRKMELHHRLVTKESNMPYHTLPPDMEVAVGSRNPVKVDAVRNVVARAFPGSSVVSVEVHSGVPRQPISFKQAIQGALNRAKMARRLASADFGLGLEGGVEKTRFGYVTCGWVVAVDSEGRIGVGGGAAVLLPRSVDRLIEHGDELGTIMDKITGFKDTKRGPGALGILTRNQVTRQKAFEAGVACALAPWISPQHYT